MSCRLSSTPRPLLQIPSAPPPPSQDAYLRARLHRFAAELRDWRPGSSRADFEERREREARRLGKDLRFGAGGEVCCAADGGPVCCVCVLCVLWVQ